MRTNTLKIARLIGLTALVAAVLAPPESFGSGRMILILSSTFAFLILALDGKIPSGFVLAGPATFAFLLCHSIWISQDFYRSLDFLPILWAYYCLLGVFLYSPKELTYWTTVTLVLLSATVSGYGIYEFVWRIDPSGLGEFPNAAEIVGIPILGPSNNASISSVFTTAGSLWGFILTALPFHALVWKPGRPVLNTLLAINAVILFGVGVIARSSGFVVGLLVLVLGGLLIARNGERRSQRIALAALLLAVLPAGIYASVSDDSDPFSARFQTWLTASEIFAARPFGSGLDTYAVAQLQHQQPGADLTEHARNAPFQLLAELGIFALISALGLVIFLVSRSGALFPSVKNQQYLLLALMAWIVHSVMETNIYFASVGTLGIAVIGLWGSSMRDSGTKTSLPSARLIRIVSVVALVIVLWSGLVYVSGELLRRARAEAGNQELIRANRTLQMAARINRFDSSIFYEAGQVTLELYQDTQTDSYLHESTEFFRNAVKLSPNKVGPRFGLALCLSSSNQLEQALEELRRAQSIHPYGRHISSVRRLIESRLAGLTEEAVQPEVGPDENENER